MSLYYEAADVLTAPTSSGGSLKSRVFSKKDLKSPPAQIYALVIETCKWSAVLKEVIENTELLKLERKVSSLHLSRPLPDPPPHYIITTRRNRTNSHRSPPSSPSS